MRSFVTVIAAFLSFTFAPSFMSSAHAGPPPPKASLPKEFDDGVFFRMDGKCYTRWGILTDAGSYCEDSDLAPRPKVRGKGSFAPCSVQTELSMLDGDDSPIHFLANGKTYRESTPGSGITKDEKSPDGRNESIVIARGGTAKMAPRERDIFVERDSAGNITKIASTTYVGADKSGKIDKSSKIYSESTYLYPAPSHQCVIDRFASNVLQGKKIRGEKTMVMYDSQLCKTVLGIVGKNTTYDASMYDRIHRAIFARSMELSLKEKGGDTRPLVFQGTPNEVRPLIKGCRAGGTPEDLRDYSSAAKKSSGAATKSTK